jgi:hypothetical protein
MIDWSAIQYFNANEFSEDPTYLADPKTIMALDQFRKLLNQRIYPSPVKGALARLDGNPGSQHYIGTSAYQPVRKSTAVDVFCEGIPIDTYQTLISSKLFNGIGVYLDTRGPDGLPWIMFHIDTRPRGFNAHLPLVWIAMKGSKQNQYYYPQSQPSTWSFFNDARLFADKRFGTISTPATDPDYIRGSLYLGKNPLL